MYGLWNVRVENCRKKKHWGTINDNHEKYYVNISSFIFYNNLPKISKVEFGYMGTARFHFGSHTNLCIMGFASQSLGESEHDLFKL